MKILKKNLKAWNKDTFGQLKVRIAEAELAILAYHEALDANPSESSLLDLSSAKSSLHNLLKTELDLWRQRSKIRWLQDGDRNTKFFHISAKPRGIFNRIDRISVDDNLFVDEDNIRDQAELYFSNLMQSHPITPNEVLFNMAGPSVSVEQNTSLIAVPSLTKI